MNKEERQSKKEERDRQIQHYLNEALRNTLDLLKVRVKDDVAYDVGIEQDYYELLEKFEKHIDLIKKVNKEY